MTSVKIKPQFYQCGGCGFYHSTGWNGDCREDDARFTSAFLDKQYGDDGWIEIEQEDL
jgi:hypothetical protein